MRRWLPVVAALLLWPACIPGPDTGDETPQATPTYAPDPDPWYCADDTWQPTDAGIGAWQVATDHYQIYAETDLDQARELGLLMEAGWQAYEQYFDAQPDLVGSQRLQIGYYRNEDNWLQAIADDGLSAPPGSAGIYHPTNSKAYLYTQPTTYYSLGLLLHEAGHQFHYLAKTNNRSLVPWYAEGIAEYFGRYDWDGQCLRLGRSPLLSQEDIAADALDELELNGFDLSAIIGGTRVVGRPLMWLIVRYFEHAEQGAYTQDFAAYRDLMDAGSLDHLGDFEAIFGPASNYDQPITTWLQTDQEVMTPVYLEWTHRGPHELLGRGDGFTTFARLKQEVDYFNLRFTPPAAGAWAAGALYAWRDIDEYRALLVGDDNRLWSFEMESAQAEWFDMGPAPTPEQDGSYRVTVRNNGKGAAVEVNSTTLDIAHNLPPAGGAALYDSPTIFTGIRWQ